MWRIAHIVGFLLILSMLAFVVAGCLSKDVQRRPATVSEWIGGDRPGMDP